MNKLKTSLFAVAMVVICVYFSACSKKDNPSPSNNTNNNNTSTHTPGSTEGTVTFKGITTSTLKGSVYTSYGYMISCNNQAADAGTNFVSGYPSVNITFGSKPTKDSTYTINSNNYVSIYESSDSYNGYYTIFSGGSIVVDVTGSQYTATFTNLTLKNSANQTATGSGSITAY